MPKLVFRKSGVQDETEAEQINFINMVRDYGSGVFYDEFTDVPNLMTQVVAALGRVSSAPSVLEYEALAPSGVPAFTWRDDWQQASDRRTSGQQERGVIELHIAPITGGDA